MPTQQPFTKIFVASGISAGEISYMDENKQIYTQTIQRTEQINFMQEIIST
jgi:hypothetical protein